MAYEIRPATVGAFDDVEAVFGPRGGWSGCWCQWNRLTNAEFQEQNYEPNRLALSTLLEQEREHGVLAYDDGTPVGWAALAPRTEYPRLDRSPVTIRVDDVPVWSVTCFVVHKDHRGRGVATALLAGVEERARQLGAGTLEGYPVAPDGRLAASDAWHGLESMFVAAGFDEVARPKPQRPIYRKKL